MTPILPRGPQVVVVIPHYQRERGVLARALRSVLEQDFQGGIHVAVVDDGSPMVARAELAGLPDRPDVDVRVIEQENAGCGAARNTGMEAAPDSTRYCAMLDSDDTWSPDHLSRATSALERGHDFYFSNWIPLGVEQDAHSYFRRLDLRSHEAADWAEDMWLYRGDFFVQELTYPVGRVSTNVFRRDTLGDLRFYTGFTNCCEDILFRLDAARRDPSIVFSSKVETHSGAGVNINGGRPWGSPGYFALARDQLEFAREVKRRFSLDSREERIRRGNHVRTRNAAVANLFSLLRRRQDVPWSSLRRLWEADPWLPAAAPEALLRALTGRLE